MSALMCGALTSKYAIISAGVMPVSITAGRHEGGGERGGEVVKSEEAAERGAFFCAPVLKKVVSFSSHSISSRILASLRSTFSAWAMSAAESSTQGLAVGAGGGGGGGAGGCEQSSKGGEGERRA